jgi:predicted phage terminase large subunit-like protein
VATKIKDKDFEKRFEEIRAWIRSSVNAFDSSEEEKAARIKRAETDKKFFAETYFPHYCEDGWADLIIPEYGKDMHTDMFDLADVWNEPVVIAGHRECAKSTIITFFDEIHKTVYSQNKFTIIYSNTEESAASEYIMPILAELQENQRLISDFGEQKTNYWSFFDAIFKSGKRIIALGPRMGAKGKKYKNWRPDRVIIEDLENRNSPRKKASIKRRLKLILTDLKRGLNSKRWQLIFLGNYFSKKTVIHILLKDDDLKNWHRRIYKAYYDIKGKLKSAWECRFPIKSLLIDEADNPVEFKTEMKQSPEDDESPIKEEWIQYYNEDEPDYLHLEDQFIMRLPVVTYKDPSAGSGETNDYKAIIALGGDPVTQICYVRKAVIKRMNKFRSIEAQFDMSEEYNSLYDGVESNAHQATEKEDYAIVESRRKRKLNLKMIHNSLGKEIRINTLASPIERGLIKFNRNDPGQRLLIDQLIGFPDEENDDGPDALERAYDMMKQYIFKYKKKVTAKSLGGNRSRLLRRGS